MTITLITETPTFDNERIRHQESQIDMYITPPLNGVSNLGKGTLSVGERQLYFYTNATNQGIAVTYPSIIIHATSRQDGQPCIYCQLDSEDFLPGQLVEDGPEDGEVTEIRFVPEDPDTLDTIFLALNDCAALHPDTVSDEEGEGPMIAGMDRSNGDAPFHVINGEDLDMTDGQWYTENSDEVNLSEAGQATLRRLEDALDMPVEAHIDGRFEDSHIQDDQSEHK